MKVWHIEFLTWKGIVGGASHYMANLVDEDGERTEVDRPMTMNDASALGFTNRDDIADLIEHGRENRFYSERAARSAAFAVFREVAAEDDLLLRGSHCVISPQEPLLGPEPLKSRLMELYEAYEALDGFDGRYDYDDEVRDEIDRICDEWNALVK